MTIDITTELSKVDCGQCGGVYAINAKYRERKHEVGGFWTCPYCNSQWGYPKEGSLNAQLQKKLAAERAAHDQTKAARAEAERAAEEEREARAREEKKRKRIEKRASCGLCPYCKRSFAATRMAAHVKTKHPEHVKPAP